MRKQTKENKLEFSLETMFGLISFSSIDFFFVNSSRVIWTNALEYTIVKWSTF